MGTEVIPTTALELRYRKLVETLPSSVVFVLDRSLVVTFAGGGLVARSAFLPGLPPALPPRHCTACHLRQRGTLVQSTFAGEENCFELPYPSGAVFRSVLRRGGRSRHHRRDPGHRAGDHPAQARRTRRAGSPAAAATGNPRRQCRPVGGTSANRVLTRTNGSCRVGCTTRGRRQSGRRGECRVHAPPGHGQRHGYLAPPWGLA